MKASDVKVEINPEYLNTLVSKHIRNALERTERRIQEIIQQEVDDIVHWHMGKRFKEIVRKELKESLK